MPAVIGWGIVMNRKLVYSAAILGSVLTTGIAYAGFSIHYGHHGHGHGHHYGHHSYYYGYPYYGYYRPYRHYRYGYGSYYSPRPQHYDADASTNGDPDYASRDSRRHVTRDDATGWKLLSKGKSSQALNVFSNQAQSNPKYGVAKAGYAIAVAINGDLGRGVWAMRRAFRIDPESLHYVNIDAELESVLHDLAARYENYGPDGAFMQAAFAYLRKDYATAAVQLDEAVSAGDKHKSTRRLRKLLAKTGEPVADSKYPDANNYQQ